MGKRKLPIFQPIGAFLFLLCLLIATAHAQSGGPDFSLPLDATLTVENKTAYQPSDSITVDVLVQNDGDGAVPLYLWRQTGKLWERVKLIGILKPVSESHITIRIDVEYQLEAKKKTRYALEGITAEGKKGAYFEVTEDWSGYENSVREALSGATFYILPVISVALIIIILVISQLAYTSHSEGAFEGEYTMRTLFFPQTKGRPFAEKIADFFMNPATWIIECSFVGIIVFVMFYTVSSKHGLDTMQIMALSGAGALLIPLLYFAFTWLYSLKTEKKPLRLFASIFIWGMFSAFLALIFNSVQMSILSSSGSWIEAPLIALFATAILAPIIEESLKGLGILFLSGHHEYDDALTGALLGFSCGLGFAFIENWFYFTSKTDLFSNGMIAWGGLMIYRSFFNSVAHGCFTSAISTIIGYVKSRKNIAPLARLGLIPGIFLAISLHTVFNLSAFLDGFAIATQQFPVFLFNPLLVSILAAMFFLVIIAASLDRTRRTFGIGEGKNLREMLRKGIPAHIPQQ